jgi:hypothetical protein
MNSNEHRRLEFPSEERQKEIIDTFIEVKLKDDESFLKIRETLTRIGLKSRKRDGEKPKLFQSCHILHKRGKHYIVHFKELFMLDGKSSSMDEDDIKRRNTIAFMLQNWGLCEVITPQNLQPMFENIATALEQRKLVVLPHKVKDKFELCTKYNLGKFKSKSEND